MSWKKAKLFKKEELKQKTAEFTKDIHKGGEETHDVVLTETSVTTINKKSGKKMTVSVEKQSKSA
jgi:hypothetical protein